LGRFVHYDALLPVGDIHLLSFETHNGSTLFRIPIDRCPIGKAAKGDESGAVGKDRSALIELSTAKVDSAVLEVHLDAKALAHFA
jgi:hypothetical protein